MKSIFRSVSIAAIVAGLAVTGAFAQNVCDDLDGATAKYEAFTEGYNKNELAALKAASAAGKEFLEKWGACESWKDQVAFVKPWIPKVDQRIEQLEFAPTFERFDKGVNTDNVDEIFAAGKLINAKYPQNYDVKYVMAVAGQQDVAKAVQAKSQSKYASEALSLSKSLFDGIKSGSIEFKRKLKDGTPSIGVLKHETNKEEALSRLAFAMGFINYYGLNNKKAGVAQYYEVTQIPGYFKGYPPVYATIADYYRGEALNIVKEAATKTAEYNALVDEVKKVDPQAEGAEEKVKQLSAQIEAKDKEIKSKDALIKGYIERAMDALARAHKVAKDGTPAEKKYKSDLYTDLQELYKQRFDKEVGLNEWVAAATARPFPDPNSTVQPVADEAATTTTTTSATPAVNGNGTVARKP